MITASELWTPADGMQLDAATMDAVKGQMNAAILAGPGAGKTELLAQRASFLLETNTCVAPRKILAICFKRDAATNLKERVEKRVGEGLSDRLDSKTFDAFAKGIVDRFGGSLPEWCRPSRDYQIMFPSWRDWSEFANHLSLDSPFSEERFNGEQIKNLHAKFGRACGTLPLVRPEPENGTQAASIQWWTSCMGSNPSKLTFGMISTLAATIIHHNPSIKAALQQTYSNVFLDEFQDTTPLQYALLKEAFCGSTSNLTAVGDIKQMIMVFAGATPYRFQEFIEDFDAQSIPLTTNFRSNKRIVEIINSMARIIEPNAVEVTCARVSDDLPEITDSIINFDNKKSQYKSLATFIAKQTQEDQNPLNQNDFILLVRQKANEFEPDLKEEFEKSGLTLRNEARTFNGISIQDFMSEPLAELVGALIQMAVGDRDDSPYQRVLNLIGVPMGLRMGREATDYQIEQSVRSSVKLFKGFVAGKLPREVDFSEVLENLVECFGEDNVRRMSSEYANLERYQEIKLAISEYLTECGQKPVSWIDMINEYRGKNQVRLMTVHKSKGLEAHTIIFLELQDSSFFYKANMEEERLAFFVAVSRARERLFITTTSNVRKKTKPLFDMLAAAGVVAS